MRRRLQVVSVALALLLDACSHHREPTVAAAASLRKVLPELVAAAHLKMKLVFGASGTLAKEVEGGAPIDGVIFAAKKPVEQLTSEGRAHDEAVVATNRLVLVGVKGGPALTFETLAKALPAKEVLAVGQPESVPAGQYAKDALTKLGEWDALQGRLVYGQDVAAVLAFVSRGEAAAGIVYATDVTPDVVLLDEAKDPWAPHPEVVAAAVTRDAQTAKLLAFLRTPEAQAIFAKEGFGPPSGP
jgi:molybdate transport system substrate-binding protein